MTITKLKSLSGIINIRRLCSKCGLNYNTIKNKLYNSIELTKEISDTIDNYFASEGLYLGSSLPVEIVTWYTNKIVKENPNKIFVFGDNHMRVGSGGQAQIRENSNAYGLATKLRPDHSAEGFMNDRDFELNKKIIDEDIKKIKDTGKQIVFPKDGFGTGLAELPKRAPLTYAYLKSQLLLNFRFDNDLGVIV